MNHASALRRQRWSSKPRSRIPAAEQPSPDTDHDPVTALRRAVGPGLVEVALFER
jgi:hypothetical protein